MSLLHHFLLAALVPCMVPPVSVPCPRVLLAVPLISSVRIKNHDSAALPTPHQLSTSLVSILSTLDVVSLFSFSEFLFWFVCLQWFLFGLVLFVWGFFPPWNSKVFSHDFVLLIFILLCYLDSITPVCALALYPLQLLFRYLGLSQELVWHIP